MSGQHNPDLSLEFVIPGDFPVQLYGSAELDRLGEIGEVTLFDTRPDSDENQFERVADADVILNSRGAVSWRRPLLEKLPNLKLIATCSIGTDMIDLEAAKDLGITICNLPGRTAPVTAEHAFGLMFAISKRAGFQTANLKAGTWAGMPNVLLQGKTLGIVGTGNIGSELARLANAIGMNVIAWTFHPSDERGKRLGVKYVEIDELLRSSDVISLNVSSSDDTRGMIGEREFGMMKPGTLFVNAGRGDLVDTTALVNALNSGHLGGAALDVFDEEPLPPDHPILSCEQVVLTPHLGDQTPEGVELLNKGVVDNVIAFLNGNPQDVIVQGSRR